MATNLYSFGDDASKLGDYAWIDANSGSKNNNVGQKKPTTWGIYDMHGNVFELVQDRYHDSYNGAPMDGSAWGEGDINSIVSRGGGWRPGLKYCTSSYRQEGGIGWFGLDLGFRLVRDL